MRDEMLELTRQMVRIPSVNTTPGEKEIGLFIEKYMREIPYFKEHPDQVIVQELKNDSLGRRNVFALLRGEKDDNANTVLFHGHMDTVGVEDYGVLAEYAFDPDELARKLAAVELPDEVRRDLESGEYLFGRGACDMKSGDAVFMVLMRHIAEHVKEFSGNILLSLNPVEENLHTGIVEGVEILEQIRQQYGLTYVLAINNDYTCPMYPGDPHHYIYSGVVGKLLPCFYIRGQETHVGQCFEGYDPTTVAANLVSGVNLNTEFCDGYEGEYSLPPVALKMKDLKGWYNVQTAKEALVYFNYFVHNAGVEEITEKLVTAAKRAVQRSMESVNENYRRFCALSGKKVQPVLDRWGVMTYRELYDAAKENCTGLDSELQAETERLLRENCDKRELPVSLIRLMLAKANIYHPVVVLYFAAPYCPHNTLQKDDAEYMEKLEKIVRETKRETGLSYQICKFFPSLSDSSYLASDDTEESIALLRSNFPQMEQLYPLPLEKIRSLGIKAVDFGVYGKDAHKWTERLYLPYSFEVLPELIVKALKNFL